MVNVPRIHCHSAFKHYEMYHSGHSSGYGNSIFNTTYNFNGGMMCGGGFWGGLWGGLGMGLGAGLMNFLGGGLGMFGGGFPTFGNWGGGVSKQTDGAGGKTTKKTKCNDIDRDKLADLNKRELKLEKDLEAKKPDSIKTLKKLYKDAVAAKNDSDEHHKSTDKTEYNTLINRLKELAEKNNLEVKDGELVEKTVTQQPAKITEEPHVQNEAVKPAVTEKNINDLTREEILGLTPDQAIKMLGDRINEDNETVKVPRNYNELLLAYKTGLPIQFCKNTGIRSDSSDNIQGTIVGDVPELANGKCTIKVQDEDNEHTLEFDFNNEKTTIDLKKNNGKLKVTIDDEEFDLKMNSNRVYTVESKEEEYATVNIKKPAMYNPKRKS